MAIGNYRSYLTRQGVPLAAPAQSAGPSYDFPLPPNPSDAAHAATMARILQGMQESEKSYGGLAPQVTVGGVSYANPGTLADSGMDPQQYADAVTQVTRTFLADYYRKKSAEAAAANLPGTQAPSIVAPVVNAATTAAGAVANAAGTVATTVVPGAAIDAATGLPSAYAGAVQRIGGTIKDVVTDPVGAVKGYPAAVGQANQAVTGAVEDVGGPVLQQTASDVGAVVSPAWDALPKSVQDALSTSTNKAMIALNWPREEIGAPAWGWALYQAAKNPFAAKTALSGIGGAGVYNALMTPETRAAIIAAYEQGGGKGVWENVVAKGADGIEDKGLAGLAGYFVYHAIIDTASDPLAILPVIGEGLKGASVARGTAEVAAGASDVSKGTKAISAAADVLRLPNTIPDKAVEAVASVPGRVLGALPEGAQDAAARLKQVLGFAADDRMKYGQTVEDVATAAQGYDQAENAAAQAGGETAAAAIPGAERFPTIPGQTPVAVSSDGSLIVTKGPTMAGQPEEPFRVYDRSGHLAGIAPTEAKAIDLAEQVAFRRGVGQDAGAKFADDLTQPSVAQEPTVIRQATAGGPAVVEPTLKDVPIEQPAVTAPVAPMKDIPILTPTAENPRPGWSLEPKPNGTRAVDVLAARDPALYTQIKADVLDRATNYYEPLLNASRTTDPVANRVLNAELHLEIARAAKARGVDLPVSEWELGRKARTAATVETVPARVDRMLFTPDAEATKADRAALYARGYLRKEPPRDFADVLDAKPRKGPPGYVNDLVVPDTAFGDLPPDLQAYSAGKIATDKAGKPIGHVFTQSDLQAMPMEQRKRLVKALQARQQHAYEANQLVQETRAKLHGTTVPARPEAPVAAEGASTPAVEAAPPVEGASTPTPEPTPTPEAVAANGSAGDYTRKGRTVIAPDGTKQTFKSWREAQAEVEARNGSAVFDANVPTANGHAPTPEPIASNGHVAPEGFHATTIDAISIDPAQFQMRAKPYVEDHVQTIMDHFNPDNLDPLKVRENPDGSYTVLSGHNRYEAIRRLVDDGRLPADFQVPIKIVRGDEAKILDVALTSNNLTRELLPSELGANLQRQLDGGKSWSDLLASNNLKPGKARQALDINLLPNRVKEMVDQGLIKENVGATLGEAIRKEKMTPEEIDDFWHKHGVNRVTKDGRANPYTPETLKFDLDSLASAKAEAARQAELKAAGADQNGMMGLFGDMQIDFGTKTVDDLLTRSQQLFEDLKAAKADEAAFKRVTGNANLSEAEKAPVLRERLALQKRINQNEFELGRPLSTFDLPTPKPTKDTLGIVNQRSAFLIDRIKTNITPKGITPLPEVSPDPIGLLTSDPIKAHEAAGRLSTEHAEIMDRTLTVGTGKAAETMRVFERYDQLVLDGMTEKQAALQVAKEYAGAQFPRMAAEKGTAMRAVQKAAHAYDAANQAIRETVMYNMATGGRGSFADLFGDDYSMIATGHWGAVKNQFKGLRAIFRMVRHSEPIELRKISYLREIQDAGGLIPERYVDHAWTRAAEGTGDMTITRASRAVGGDTGAALSRPAQIVLQNKLYRDGRNALDMGRRLSTMADQFGTEIRDGARRFDLNLSRFANKTGQDASEIKAAIVESATERAKSQGRDWSGVFSPEDVRVATGDEQLTRAWRAEVNRAMNVADKESQRVLFSYNRYPIDRQLGRAVYFHYWSTRALALHTGIALRNPWLLAAYARTWDGLGKIAEANGYPDSLKGMVRFMGSSAGWSSFVNPVGLLVPYMMFSDFKNDNAPAWERAGIYLAPFVEGGLAALGMTDSTPDVTGTLSVRNMARAVLNWADANGHSIPGIAPDGHLTDDYLTRLEQTIYGAANDALRGLGITGKEYGPYDPNTSQVAQIRAVIMQQAIDGYGPMDQWPSSLTAMVTDAITKTESGNMLDNPLSKAAYQAVAGKQLETRGLGMGVPGGVVTKYGPLETNRALNTAATAAYKTGGQPTPDQQFGSDVMDYVNAGSPEALKLTQDQDAYTQIGTDRDKGLSDGWSSIAYGTGVDPADTTVGVVIGGTFIRYVDLATVPTDQRKVLADQWVADWDGTDELKAYRDKRDAFVAAHPEYGDFKDYQSTAYGYKGGLTTFRADTAKANPNFAREMAAREKLIRDGGTTDPKVVSAELDSWAAGPAGYEAAVGIKGNLYSDAPIATRDQSQVPYIAGQEGGGASSDGGQKSSSKTSTADLLTGDIASYQQQQQLLTAMLAQHGMGALDQYTSPYMQPWIQATFGDAIPKTTPLMDAYVKWAGQQPQGADQSIDAFAATYDAVDAAVGSTGGTTSNNRLMTLYLAWKAQQAPGTDTSPDAFARYLRSLSAAT